jgi:hypothetical protein
METEKNNSNHLKSSSKIVWQQQATRVAVVEKGPFVFVAVLTNRE